MDNITHTLAGALVGEMGLKRRSRFAFAACLLGANAPDIDVFVPLAFPVESKLTPWPYRLPRTRYSPLPNTA